ncbi:hypothetical protein H5410_017196 [Solanum commersonii]|uniref:Uncharacterized protein n=1 Tax=Solanum commersonii TaxID=4109 RepID=A0A9J5ZZN4_SOLCO|nr:hypothetical protein H5410_017196 [Solanum commersonii]
MHHILQSPDSETQYVTWHVKLNAIYICCSDSSKMSTGACWIIQKQCIFEGSDTGAATFLESPSNLAINRYDISKKNL